MRISAKRWWVTRRLRRASTHPAGSVCFGVFGMAVSHGAGGYGAGPGKRCRFGLENKACAGFWDTLASQMASYLMFGLAGRFTFV